MIYRQLGETSAQAMQAIKARHGADVIVIATHETAQGVEVVFTVDAGDGFAPVSDGRPVAAESPVASVRSGSSTSDASDSNQLSGWLGSDAVRAGVWQTFTRAGFSSELSCALLESLPPVTRPEAALRQALEALQMQLQTHCPAQEIIDRGGVYALVGPTGSGKTTTVAKLAVRCLAAHGKGSVSIVTTDTYRIGAVDQLKIYGRVLGVNVHVANSADALRKVLDDQKDVHLTLVDTMGLSPRDARVSSQVSDFDAMGIQKLLVLSAASQAGVQRDVIARFSGKGFHGCVLSKLDEASELGGTLDAVLRHGLKLAYVSVGQRVPEDLHRVDPVYLAWQALPEAMSGSFRLEAWMDRWQRWGLLPGVSQTLPVKGEATL